MMKFLSSEEGKVSSVAALNILTAAVSPWGITESVMRLVLLAGQIAIAYLTALYVYRKVRAQKKHNNEN